MMAKEPGERPPARGGGRDGGPRSKAPTPRTPGAAPPCYRRRRRRPTQARGGPRSGARRRCGHADCRSARPRGRRPRQHRVRRRPTVATTGPRPARDDRVRGGRPSCAAVELESSATTSTTPAKRGTVLGQDPAAGAGGRRTAWSCSRSRPADVGRGRDLVGLAYDEAARELVGLGLVPAGRGRAARGRRDRGQRRRRRLPLGTTVTLSVGVEPAEPTAGMTPVGPAKPPTTGRTTPPTRSRRSRTGARQEARDALSCWRAPAPRPRGTP